MLPSGLKPGGAVADGPFVPSDVWDQIPEEWLAAGDRAAEQGFAAPDPVQVQVPMFVAPGSANTESTLEESSKRHQHLDDPILSSFLLAIIASFVSGVGWYGLATLTHRQVPFAAVGVGLFVGLAMMLHVRHTSSLRLSLSAGNIMI